MRLDQQRMSHLVYIKWSFLDEHMPLPRLLRMPEKQNENYISIQHLPSLVSNKILIKKFSFS